MLTTRIERPRALLPALLGALALAGACASAGQGTARGHELTQVRTVPHFARLAVHGPARVEVTVGAPPAVTVRAGERSLAGLLTEVVGETLHVRPADDEGVPEIRVDLPHLASISCSGGAGARISGLRGGLIEMELEGTGTIWASGSVDRLVARVDGAGRLDLDELATRDADVRVRGSGAVEVTVSGALDAAVEGAGGVVYHGDPIVWSETSGSGSVSRR